MHFDLLDVLIVEDEATLARLLAEQVSKHPRLRLVGIADSLASARQQLRHKSPHLVLLDNYLTDGKGITLLADPLIVSGCGVIFITAASDMETCSQAIRNGAFDYILKPVAWKRLSQSLARFVQFVEQQRTWKMVDQNNVDALYQLQARNFRAESNKGIEERTLALIQGLFSAEPARRFSVDEVAAASQVSKTTARRYLEHGVDQEVLAVEMQYGNIGHPRRLYFWAAGRQDAGL